MENLTIEYIFIIEKFVKENQTNYVCTYNESNSSQKYIYENNFDELISIENKEEYIDENDIIVFFLDSKINKYLYDTLLTSITYNSIQDLNNTLKLKTIDYNELNNIIETQIDSALNNIKHKFNISSNTKRFYFHLKYNKLTYYPYIDDIKLYIKDKIKEIFHINLDI